MAVIGATSVITFLNDKSGAFALPVTHSLSLSTVAGWTFGDVDNDGDQDFVVTQGEVGATITKNLSVVKNNGNATFAAKVDYAYSCEGPGFICEYSLGSPVLADLDGNGTLDLATSMTSGYGQSLGVSLNGGTGNYGTMARTVVTASDAVMVSGDVDVDGDVDLVIGNTRLLKNNGNATFAAGVTLPSFGRTMRQMVDVDNDGDLDLVGDDLTISVNDGSGNFVSATTYGANNQQGLTHAIDVDNDGDLDALGVNSSNRTVVVYLNKRITLSSVTPQTTTNRFSVAGSDGSTAMAISQAGDINFSGVNDTGYVATFRNESTATTADGIMIDLGIGAAARSYGNNNYIGFASQGVVVGRITGHTNQVIYETTGADYAEYFRADPLDLPEGQELVAIDSLNDNSVVRAVAGETKPLAGVVSTNPGFVGNGPICRVGDENCSQNYAEYNALVALSGQVTTKVDTSAGPIAIGDPITASSVTDGYGAKAIGSGYIIGYALEPLEAGTGVVKVLIRPQFYTAPMSDILQGTGLNITGDSLLDGNVSVTGTMSVLGTSTLATLTVTENTTIQQDLEVQGSVTIAQNLTVQGNTTVQNITVNGKIITAGNTPTAVLGASATGQGATVIITGNDTAGTITYEAGSEVLPTNPLALGEQATVTFVEPYATQPRVTITANTEAAAKMRYYVVRTTTEFKLVFVDTPVAGQEYTFDYQILQ
jgi:hypothetical protein